MSSESWGEELQADVQEVAAWGGEQGFRKFKFSSDKDAIAGWFMQKQHTEAQLIHI